MKTLYLDLSSGISGDMFLGALIDLGVEARRLEQELAKLQLEGWQLQVTRGQKMGITGVKFDVRLGPGRHHEHAGADGATAEHPPGRKRVRQPAGAPVPARAQDAGFGPHGGPLVQTSRGVVELSVFEAGVPPRFRLYFFQGDQCAPPPPADAVALETIRPDQGRQTFKFKRQGDWLEATEELPEPHEFTAVLKLKRGKRVERHATQFRESHHHHAPAPGLSSHAHPVHGRTFADIRSLIQTSRLSAWTKAKALAVFERVAVAEGKIHGQAPERVHFHEVGAVDSILDIVGACVALELLGQPRVLAGPVVEGTGFLRCAHGRFPLPAPATLEILGARGIAITQCEEPHELVTPTGAALLAEFAERFGPMRGLVVAKVGYGLGTRELQTRPNVLRAVLGETAEGPQLNARVQQPAAPQPAHDWETDTIAVLETNLDDISAELLGHFVERALAAGALDVFHTPIQMKKNRPGVLLTVLCAEADADALAALVLRETTSFGVRRHTAERRKLRRTFTTVRTPFGEVTVKLGQLDGQVLQAAPEFESCREAAARANVPLKVVFDAALRAMKP